jgi:3-hydroxybutyryl-CoA dehydratase
VSDEASTSFPGVVIGDEVGTARTISESDVYLFAGLTGDIGPNHTNDSYMRETAFGQRVAHGALTLGLMSTCSTKLIERMGNPPVVNYGYERVRFVRPVFFGDTVTVRYIVREINEDRGLLTAEATATNQRDEVVAAATNLLRRFT